MGRSTCSHLNPPAQSFRQACASVAHSVHQVAALAPRYLGMLVRRPARGVSPDRVHAAEQLAVRLKLMHEQARQYLPLASPAAGSRAEQRAAEPCPERARQNDGAL